MEENSFISDSNSFEEIEEKSKRYEYNGYEPPIGFSNKIDEIVTDIKTESLFNDYVIKRKPVVIKGFLTNEDFKIQNWNLSYLKEKAGDCKVMIEDRSKSETSDVFGMKAPKISMNYSQFLDLLSQGEEELYMTTQDLDSGQVDKFGMCTAIFADPLTYLKDDFPQTPKCFSFLVPHLISLWQGCSKKGTSSGLHHDFHDNLYIVIRGSKRFKILPPSNHAFLRMPINPVRIYSNGLIVYSRNKYYPDLIPIRSDGVPYEFLAQTIRDEAKVERTRCKNDIKRLKKENATTELLKKLNNEMLEYELQIETAEEEMSQYNGQESDGESNHISIQDSDEEPSEKKTKIEVEPKFLEHFSSSSLNTFEKDFDQIFANFDKRDEIRCLEVNLNEGDALYLPASWFHEVTSYSRDSNNMETLNFIDLDHLALSYWFYPPDGESIDKPYINNFWQDRLQKITDGSVDIMPTNMDDSLSEKEENKEYDVIVLGSDDEDENEEIENDYYSEEEENSSPWRPRSVEIDHFSEHSVDSSSSSAIFVSSTQKLDSTTCLSLEEFGENVEINSQLKSNTNLINDNLISKNHSDGFQFGVNNLSNIEKGDHNIKSSNEILKNIVNEDVFGDHCEADKFLNNFKDSKEASVTSNEKCIPLGLNSDTNLLKDNDHVFPNSLEHLDRDFEPSLGLVRDPVIILDSFKEKVLNGPETDSLLTE